MLEQKILESAMRRALELAARGPAHDPNPQVGCVILDPDGRIIAEGYHQGAGSPHAETAALAHIPAGWIDRIHELTAVVTLEPCNHTGRTGPCALALIDAGIGAVAYGLKDPGVVEGGGEARLKDAGVAVAGGILAAQVRGFLAPWLARRAAAGAGNAGAAAGAAGASAGTAVETNIRPFVTVKWAQTLDGRIAAHDGSSQWITGEQARADVHVRRAEADAIAVGTGTLYADDPALTARTPTGELLVPATEQPFPIVFGTRAIPAGAKILQHPALTQTATAKHHSASPLQLAGRDLEADLRTLWEKGIRHLFVEGGPTLISALLRAGLADEALIYIAPALLGGDRLAVGDIGIQTIADIERLQLISQTQLGADVLLRAAFSPRAQAGAVAASTTEKNNGDSATTPGGN